MRLRSIAASATAIMLAGGAWASYGGLRVRAVDPETTSGASGTWAENGYAGLTTWRVYAQFDSPDLVLGVGDPVTGGLVMQFGTDGGSFVNGGLGNNGLSAPADATGIAGTLGYTAQWDSYITIAGSSPTYAPGLTAALGASLSGAGGLNGNFFALDNTGWLIPPPGGSNTTFNPESGQYEAMLMQLTVAEGTNVWGENVVITASSGTKAAADFSSVIPEPGAIALLVVAGGLVSRRRRRTI